MARSPDERYAEALRLFQSGKKLIEIANQLNLPEGTVRRWKSTHKWDSERSDNKSERSHKSKGGQPGNKNATGPPENKNAEKYGFFAKWLPQETMEIMQSIQRSDPLDLLWDNIQLQYTAIIRAQKLMYVKDQDDVTTTKISEGFSDTGSSEKWEVQQAWDKHANFLQAQSRAMKTLESMINRYDEMIHKNWEKASEEQKLRISKLRYEVSQLSGGADGNTGIKDFLKAIKPTQEDMKNLFADEEVNEDVEAT
jgi:uncharacterized protein YjcR